MKHIDRLPLYAGLAGTALTVLGLIFNHFDVQLESRGGWGDQYAWDHLEPMNTEKVIYTAIAAPIGGGIAGLLGLVARGVIRRAL